MNTLSDVSLSCPTVAFNLERRRRRTVARCCVCRSIDLIHSQTDTSECYKKPTEVSEDTDSHEERR